MLKSCCSDVEIPEVPIHQMIFDSIKASSDKVAWVQLEIHRPFSTCHFGSARICAEGLTKINSINNAYIIFSTSKDLYSI